VYIGRVGDGDGGSSYTRKLNLQPKMQCEVKQSERLK